MTIAYESNELYHYGVKGMKWGVIRASKTIGKAATSSSTKNAFKNTVKKTAWKKYRTSDYSHMSKRRVDRINKKLSKINSDFNDSYTKEEQAKDYRSFRKSGVKRINKRMNEGKSHEAAVNIELGRQAAMDVVKSIGRQVVTEAALGYLAIRGMQYVNRDLPRLEMKPFDTSNAIDAVFEVLD